MLESEVKMMQAMELKDATNIWEMRGPRFDEIAERSNLSSLLKLSFKTGLR
jgi:hypothetical protein